MEWKSRKVGHRPDHRDHPPLQTPTRLFSFHTRSIAPRPASDSSPFKTANLPSQYPTGNVSIRYTLNTRDQLEMQILSIPHRDTQSPTAIPRVGVPSQANVFRLELPITHDASPTVLRLRFSERNVTLTTPGDWKTRSTSQLRSRIGYLSSLPRSDLLWSISLFRLGKPVLRERIGFGT
ncbi:hypothetical protein VTI28DRAFT_5034 [Corynascus sepedonium]